MSKVVLCGKKISRVNPLTLTPTEGRLEGVGTEKLQLKTVGGGRVSKAIVCKDS